MIERWLSVVGYEGRYEVSDLGRVRSLPNARRHSTIIMKTPLAVDGYPVVGLHDGVGKRTVSKVHRLVLFAFEGPPPVGKPYGLHRFGDRSNPALSGLYWGSPQSNQEDRAKHGTCNSGERNGMSTLKRCQVVQIKEFAKTAKRGDMANLSRGMGVNYATMMDVVSGKSWKSI